MRLSRFKKMIGIILVICTLITSSSNLYAMGVKEKSLKEWEEDVQSPSGIYHRSRITYEIEDELYADYDASHHTVIQFSLNYPTPQDISFDYKIYAGSGMGEHFSAIEEGKITFSSGETQKSLDIEIYKLVNHPIENGTISNPSQFWTKDRVLYVSCTNIENALFQNDKESMMIPIPIQNQFDLTQSYENAKNTYLADLSKLTDVTSFPETLGKYLNNEDRMDIAVEAEMEGDLRTIIDLGVFSHLNLPTGFFLRAIEDLEESENSEEDELIGNVLFKVSSDPIGSEIFQDLIPIHKNKEANFNLGDVAIGDLYLGPYWEANVMATSLSAYFDYSTVTEAVYTYFNDDDGSYIEKQMNFVDKIRPHVKNIEAPNGTFYYGESIPITITYNEPVFVDQISIVANNKTLYPVERNGTISNKVSFLFEVEEEFQEIEIRDVKGAVDLEGNLQKEDEERTWQLFSSTMGPFDPEKSFAYFAETTVNISYEDGMASKGEIIIKINENQDLMDWLGGVAELDGLLPLVKAKVIGQNGPIDVPFYINEGVSVTHLRGEFNLPSNETDENHSYLAEIYFKKNTGDEFKIVYPLLKEYTIAPIIYIDHPSDLAIIYKSWPSTDRIFTDSSNILSLGYEVKNNATWQEPMDFQWSSSNESIAVITNGGNILLTGKAGTVRFTLTALNGGMAGREFSIGSKTLEVVNGAATFLNIPISGKNIEVVKGKGAIVHYTTNIVENNGLYGGSGTKTRFQYDLYEAKYVDDVLTMGDLVHTETIDATLDNNFTSYSIDQKHLVNISERGKFSYIFNVSARDLETNKILSASANISIKEEDLPARAILYKPNNFYRTDEEEFIDIRFHIENLNLRTEFDLSVTKNSESSPFFFTDTAGNDEEISIHIEAVESHRLLDVYTIALKAKNESDQVFSYDSYILYVYNSNALKIMVGDRVRSQWTMSLHDRLSAMTSEEILALNRNISLKDTISINHREYKWSNLADRILWEVGDNEKISLKYKEGGTYREIEDANVPLLPGMEFLLEGLSPGRTVLKATHYLTGMTASVDIEVDAIKDKLYIFQVYPAQETTVEYRDSNNNRQFRTTNENGRIAIYEANGIKGDITFYPENTTAYGPVIVKSSEIVANQNTTNEFGLYPQTVVTLPLAQYKASILLYDEEMNRNHSGDIKIKGGVYRNGIYCPNAKINGLDGKIEQIISADEGGFYALNFNFQEFVNREDTTPLKMEDQIEYVIEISFPEDAYLPKIIKIDNEAILKGKVSPYGASSFENIQKLDIMKNLSNGMLFYQTINMDGKTERVDGAIIYEEVPNTAIFSMEMAIKGDPTKDYQIQLINEAYSLNLVSDAVREGYQFSDTVILRSEFDLQDFFKNMREPDAQVYLRLRTLDSASVKEVQLSKPLRIMSAANIPKMDTLLQTGLKEITSDFTSTIKSPASLSFNQDDNVKRTLEFLSKYSGGTDSIRLEVKPTDNPLVYKGIVKFAMGDLTRENPSGVFMADTSTDEKFSFLPGISDIKSMSKGEYLYKSSMEMDRNKYGYGGASKTYGGGAYLETEIYYDIKAKEWRMILLNTDVYIGAGGSYTRVVNAWVGPVPVTAEFVTGMTAQVGRRTIVHQYYWDEEKNEYYAKKDNITELRPYLYIYGFGGFGADYKVASLKVGVYGQIGLDQQYLWLNGSDGKKNGQRVTISGETGIKFSCKISIIKYSKKVKLGGVSKTWKFNRFDEINKLYSAKQGNTIFMSYGEDEDYYYYLELEPMDETMEFEDRSYLENYTRQWYSPLQRRGFMEADMTILQTNAYPYANPVLSDDGMLMVYLHDNHSMDINDTALYFTKKDDLGFYSEGEEVHSSSFADTDLVMDGNKDGAVVAWTRIMDEVVDTGEEVSDEILNNIMEKTEIMASIYDGERFTTTQLTNNSSVDMLPVAATNGNKAIVAWRGEDILYSLFDGSDWSTPEVLYEGEADRVLTMNVEMLSNGTSAITYEMIIEGSEDTEVIYAIVDENGDLINHIQLIHHRVGHGQPQITALTFPDHIQRFMVGWYTENKIQLKAINANGTLYPDFEMEVEDREGLSNYRSFKFAKGAKYLEDLSILWTETDNGEYAGSDTVHKDNIWARKLILEEENIMLSPKIKLLDMEDHHGVDFFNAYVDTATGDIHFGLLVSDNTHIDEPEAKLAIAKSSYKNILSLEEVYFSREDILPQLDMPIMFTLYNGGVEPVTELNIVVGDREYEIVERIDPGEYKNITLFYTVPETIADADFEIRAKFTGSYEKMEGTLKMAVPDIRIQDIQTIKENSRQRILRLMLGNKAASKLVAGKHTVKVEIYQSHDFNSIPLLTETIATAKDLERIDQGVYTKEFILDEAILSAILDKDGEIPLDGQRIFFNVVIEEDGKPMEDTILWDNMDYVKIYSLISKENGAMSIGSFMEAQEGNTFIQVEAFNNSMNAINNGNIIVNLKDEKGNIIETQQTYNSLSHKGSLIKIAGEESLTTQFNFKETGTSYDVVFENVLGVPEEPKEPEKPTNPTKPEDPWDSENIEKPRDSEKGKEPEKPKEEEKPPYHWNIFKDVSENSWFYEAVQFVYENGLMVGTGEQLFSPNSETTRGMLITVLYRLEGEPKVEQSKFIDVLEGAYYGNAVAWGEANGIVHGISEREFAPNGTMTREQFVVFLYRYTLYKGYDTNQKAQLSTYEDARMISEYALNAMEWAVGKGLIRGRSETKLAPQGNITRAEMATVLQRFLLGIK